MASTRFGKYEIVDSIAMGGMGEVYLAKAPGLAGFEKLVALKVIRHDLVHNREFVDALVAEAKLAVRLHHTNIVQVFDLGREGERYFLAMEYVDGLDVFRMVGRAQNANVVVPCPVAAYIAAEVAAGADYAHNRRDERGNPLGIIHRDLNPHNVLVGFDGEVKIADFGIAKVRAHAKTTAAGVIKGKLTYLSPEQARAERADHRADVFGIGIVLYETLTGQKLYKRDSDISAVLARVKDADFVKPRKHRRDIPKPLEAIVLKALTRDADKRYQTAEELREALLQWLHHNAPEFSRRGLEEFMRSLREGASAPAVPLEPTLQKGDGPPTPKASLPKQPSAPVAEDLEELSPWDDDADTNPSLVPADALEPIDSPQQEAPRFSRPSSPRIAPPPPTPVPVFDATPRNTGDFPALPMADQAAPTIARPIAARAGLDDVPTAPAPPVASPRFGEISTDSETGATSRMTPDQVRAAAAWVAEMSGQHPALSPAMLASAAVAKNSGQMVAVRRRSVAASNGGVRAASPMASTSSAAAYEAAGATRPVSTAEIEAIRSGPSPTPAGGSLALRHTPPLGHDSLSGELPAAPTGHTVPLNYKDYAQVARNDGLSSGARLLLAMATLVLVLGAAALALILSAT